MPGWLRICWLIFLFYSLKQKIYLDGEKILLGVSFLRRRLFGEYPRKNIHDENWRVKLGSFKKYLGAKRRAVHHPNWIADSYKYGEW